MKPAAFWLALVFMIAIAFMLHEAPLEVIVAAAVPAMAYAAIAVALLRPDESLALLVALFLWGAAVAAPAAERANRLLGATALGPAIWAPLVEETLKALGLVLLVALRPEQLNKARSGIACGMLVGLGFASAENIHYLLIAVVQGGAGGLARAVFVRGVLQGLNHATFTGAVGAGLGFARRLPSGGRTAAAPVLGFLLACAQHSVWNGVASFTITDLLCGATTAAGACQATPPAEALYFQVPVLVALFIGPGLATLAWLARESMVGTSRRTASGR
jgi:RsiW-degrading membrane proteinase PrsW (M82 family)